MAKKVEGVEDAKKGEIVEIEKAGNAKKGGMAHDAKAKAAEEQAELARKFSVGQPLSEIVIQERADRV